MKVYFSHGKTGGPGGRRMAALAAIAEARGCAFKSIDYTDERDSERRAARLLRYLLTEPEQCLLVGTGMGACVSLLASEHIGVQALFLMSPSLYSAGCARRDYLPGSQRIELVHGWSDRIEPPENSIMFAREMGATLHLIPGDHGLRRSLGAVSTLFEHFLDVVLSQQTASRSLAY